MGQTKQKRWTKTILNSLEKAGFHPVDVQYGNGYFIFEHGKDMVIHFHIKELKGWKFGIWWNLDGEKTFDFFTQYERDIDKFKPSASALVVEDACLEDWRLKDIVQICKFIKKHPYRAWAIDQTWGRDIWEWDTIEWAFKDYWLRWWRDSVRYPRVHEKMTKRYLKLVTSICNICLVDYEIIDGNTGGWISSPRFHIVCDDAAGEELEMGKHYWLDFKQELPDWLLKKIARYNKKMKKLGEKYWRLHDVELGDGIGFTVRKEEYNGRSKRLQRNDKPVVADGRKGKKGTGKKKSTSQVPKKDEKVKSAKKG